MTEKKIIGERRTDAEIAPYMSRDEMMAEMQKTLDMMIEKGIFPTGATVHDVRVREIRMLVKLPDGRCMEIGAMLVPESEMREHDADHAMTFFGPSTKQ